MEERKEVLMVAHGDLDGIVSAALQIKGLDLETPGIRFTFTQPFLLEDVKVPEGVQRVFVVDVAVNNRDPEMTREFVGKITDKLKRWTDHHRGWEIVLPFLDEAVRGKFSIFSDSESAAGIIAVESAFPESFPVGQLVADANAADTRQGELSERGCLIDEAIKANLSNDTVREAAVRWIVNGCQEQEDENYKKLRETQQKYQAVQEMTEKKLVKQYEIHNGVAVVDVRDVAEDYDWTQLLLKGEQIAPTKTAVLLGISPEGEEIITVATMDQEKNLVNLFGLPSGASSRISLPTANWTMEKVLDLLTTALKK